MTTYFPGTRVLVCDGRLSHTMRAATVTQWYSYYGVDPHPHVLCENLIDVRFDHRLREESRGHSAYYAEIIS